MNAPYSHMDHDAPHGPQPGAASERASTTGIFTALGLILLTLVVYLFSLSLPDEERRQAVYASLAKAFMFSDRKWIDERPDTHGLLLSAPKEALRGLTVLLADPAQGDVSWEAADLVVTLPAEALLAAPEAPLSAHHIQVLRQVSRLAAASGAAVSVDGYGSADRIQALALAIRLAHAMTVGPAALAPELVGAVGHGRPFPSTEGDRSVVRIVVMDLEAAL